MDNEELIYDIVKDTRDMLIKRLDEQEYRISLLETFKTKILTISGFITIIISVSYNFVKDWFHAQ